MGKQEIIKIILLDLRTYLESQPQAKVDPVMETALKPAIGKRILPDPTLRFLTTSLHVDYLLPTPLGVPLEIRGQVKKVKGRKVVVASALSANGKVCARGEVVAVQVPEHLIPGHPENRGQSQNMQGSS